MNKKIGAFFLISSFLLSSCADLPIIKENYKEVGQSVFTNTTKSKNLNIIFFDDDNLVSKDGRSVEVRTDRGVKNNIGSSDSYMAKFGDVEMLVDCGFQTMTSRGQVINNNLYEYEFLSTDVQEEVEENLLKKIATVIDKSGYLDYLIVTHADFDHIAALIVKNGIFDAFMNQKTVIDLKGREVTLKGIKNIIDFDSGLVKHFSDESIDKEKRLVGSDYYQCYIRKRDRLVRECNANYCPVSAFFDNEVLQPQEIVIDKTNKDIGMPDKVAKRLRDAGENTDVQLILDENFDNGVETTLNSSYANSELLSPENGHMAFYGDEEDPRYYYSLNFGKAELRLLYNWHYDYIFRSSFNEKEDGDDTQMDDAQNNTFDSQDANNISVCFEIVYKSFKYLGVGDLGGNGENGLLNYYRKTDVLSHVTLYKASHHGSTGSGNQDRENSRDLFKATKPKIIVITGCAFYKNKDWKNTDDDRIMAAVVGRPTTKQRFFENVSKVFGDGNMPYILCTNICQAKDGYFISAPFYGDIKVSFSDDTANLSYSYVGEIFPYISQEFENEYREQNDNKEYSFYTRKDNKYLSFYKTDWFNQIGYYY